jgi:hypothetical protein
LTGSATRTETDRTSVGDSAEVARVADRPEPVEHDEFGDEHGDAFPAGLRGDG